MSAGEKPAHGLLHVFKCKPAYYLKGDYISMKGCKGLAHDESVPPQEVASAARKRAAGLLEASSFMEVEASREATEAVSADEAAASAEQQYTTELQKELAGRAGLGGASPAEHPEEALEQQTKVRSSYCASLRPLLPFLYRHHHGEQWMP